MSTSIGEQIKVLRIATGKNQKIFSDGIMSKSSYSRIELGQQALIIEDFFYLLKRTDKHSFIFTLKNLEYKIKIEFI